METGSALAVPAQENRIQIFVPAGNAYSQTEPVACVLIPAPNGGPPVVISGGGGDGGPEGFYFTPYPIYNGVATGTVTATGSGLSAKYGMPLFQYYNSQGNLVAQVNASSISSDGTHAYGPVPAGISSVPAGIYFGVISNANSSGGYTVIGSGGATVAAGTPPPIRRATITISGSERSKYFAAGCSTRWDGGYLAIYVNGNELASVPYGDSPNNSCTAPSPMPTASGLATQLANLINGNIESPVDASVSGSTITLSTNARAFNSPSYSFTTQIVSYFVQAGFPPASFTMPASGNLQ